MKKINKQIAILYSLVFSTLLILNLFSVISDLVILSAIYAGVLNLINSLAAFLLFEYSFNRSNKSFLTSTLGGMAVRLLFLLGAVFICLKFLNIDKYGFILIFFIFYFILLVFEINYFRLKMDSKSS